MNNSHDQLAALIGRECNFQSQHATKRGVPNRSLEGFREASQATGRRRRACGLQWFDESAAIPAAIIAAAATTTATAPSTAPAAPPAPPPHTPPPPTAAPPAPH